MKFLAATLLIFTVSSQIFHASGADQKPYDKQHWERTNQLCSRLLRTPQEARDLISQKKFDDDANEAMHCVIRCTGIVSGTYDDERGTVMEMMEVQAQGKTGFAEYRSAAEDCYGGFGPEDYGDDWCKKSYLYFKCDWKAWVQHVKKVE
ncbi:uncharacterized protein LOC119766940 [Culex quinquefasciatus]|uniref:uncharacterized protein LOC119766940 n=1 Tax=Culex quinquefasciatus TaxID=7176 RepID=UPI00016D72FB|nr:uncharacterized protein LOC119766940 [Culex quinquefasciatus]